MTNDIFEGRECCPLCGSNLSISQSRADRTRNSKYGKIICRTAESLALVDSKVFGPRFVDYCVDAMTLEPGKRDLRRQVIVRALRGMKRFKVLPFRVEGGYYHFD